MFIIFSRGLNALALFFANFISDDVLDTRHVGCPAKMADQASFPIWNSQSTIGKLNLDKYLEKYFIESGQSTKHNHLPF